VGNSISGTFQTTLGSALNSKVTGSERSDQCIFYEIRLLILAQADFHGQFRGRCARLCQEAALTSKTHPQTARVGAVAQEPEFELVVGLATLVAQHLQAAGLQSQQEIGVAILIKNQRC